jgi:hypothetical protein
VGQIVAIFQNLSDDPDGTIEVFRPVTIKKEEDWSIAGGRHASEAGVTVAAAGIDDHRRARVAGDAGCAVAAGAIADDDATDPPLEQPPHNAAYCLRLI